MIIDAHLHIGLNNWDENRLLSYLDRNQIDKAWILTWDEYKPALPIYYQPLDIEAVFEIFRNHPDRIVPFYAPDPTRNDWKEKINKYIDMGLGGCGELKVPLKWNDPAVKELLEFLDQKEMPLVFHMEKARNVFIPVEDKGADWLFKRLINERYNGKSARIIYALKKRLGILDQYLEKRTKKFEGYLMGPDELEKAISDFPNISFIGHGPGFWNLFATPDHAYKFHQTGKITGEGRMIQLLGKYRNFYCDISGFSGFNALSRDKVFSKTFFENHYKKILFGTDNMELGHLNLLKELDLSSDVMDNILFKNAEFLLKD